MHCYFSYYALFDLCYKHQAEKTTTAKRLGAEEGISVREAGHWLDANIFLNEYWKWKAQTLQRPFILHRMFYHAAALSKKEHDRTICWGWRHPTPKWDLEVEVPTMDLICPGMFWADIRNIYNDVYQLKRLPEERPCDGMTAERVCQSILESVKEHLQCRQEHIQSQEQGDLDRVPRSHPPPKSQPGTHVLHEHIEPESYDEALVVGRDTHYQAL